MIFTENNGSSFNADSITPNQGENWLSAVTTAYNGSVTSSAALQPFAAMLSGVMPPPENKRTKHHSRDACSSGDLISGLALVLCSLWYVSSVYSNLAEGWTSPTVVASNALLFQRV